jgi:hypothetical protein
VRSKRSWPHALAIFCGAFLLFLVQPLIAKFILPWFGGGAAVWTTCLLFFQIFLLAGYAYAHGLVRYLRPRAQAAVHVALLSVAIALLPITPSLEERLAGPENPTVAILLLLAGSIGLQYLLLSATSPLLQGWFAQEKGRPYRLYSLSNAGSLLALVAYPLLVEPALPRSTQALAWSACFVVFAGLGGACAWRVWRRPGEERLAQVDSAASAPELAQRLAWFAMPACASALLLAVTNKLTQDVAPVPFLWVLPLSLYLLSFVVCFDNPRWYARKISGTALVLATGWVCWIQHDKAALLWQIVAYSSLLFAASMVCHGEVHRRRPHVAHLTAFYMTIALGGAVGGVLVAVVAPFCYTDYYELPFGMMAALLLLAVTVCEERGFSLRAGRLRWIALALCTCILGVTWSSVNHARNRLAESIHQARNFYGVLTVYDVIPPPGADGNGHRQLVHGEITHGAQFLAEELRRFPTTYYEPGSGIGLTYKARRAGRPLKTGAIGLGVGTIAAYGEPGDELVFFEINPEVLRIALGYFTFLTDTPAKVSIVQGDARLALEASPPEDFDVLVVDAFSGDAIPVHLLTKEAFETYLRHLVEDGVIAVHISNRYLDLEPVVCRLATHFELKSVLVSDNAGGFPSKWLLLTRDEVFLGAPALRDARAPARECGSRLWTDDDTNLLEVLDT